MPVKKKSTKATTPAKKTTKVKKVEKAEVKKATPPPVVEEVVITSIETETPIASIQSQTSKKPAKKRYIITIAIILIIVGLLYAFRSQFIVATVNGQPISRSEFNTEMQKEAGKKSMDALVTKVLIIQEANKKNISVSDAEVNDQIKTIQNQLKQQGQSLNQALAMQGLTMDDLKEQVKIEKLIEKLLGNKIQVSDKEVADYMKKMQAQAVGQGDNAPAMSKDAVMQQLKQSKLNDQVQPWIQNLQSSAKINYFLNL